MTSGAVSPAPPTGDGWQPLRLRDARISRGWAVSGLAHALGVPGAIVVRWENGIVPTPRRVVQLSSVLRIAVDTLVIGTDLSAMRLRAGLSQEGLARLAGVPTSKVRAAEAGKIAVPVELYETLES